MTSRSKYYAAFVLAVALPLGALAAEPAATTEQTAPTAQAADKPAKAMKVDTHCRPATDTRIRRTKVAGCENKSAQPTRTYTKEDLERTGETDTLQALRKLDPRFY